MNYRKTQEKIDNINMLVGAGVAFAVSSVLSLVLDRPYSTVAIALFIGYCALRVLWISRQIEKDME